VRPPSRRSTPSSRSPRTVDARSACSLNLAFSESESMRR
jgi:hypothetical protein